MIDLIISLVGHQLLIGYIFIIGHKHTRTHSRLKSLNLTNNLSIAQQFHTKSDSVSSSRAGHLRLLF